MTKLWHSLTNSSAESVFYATVKRRLVQRFSVFLFFTLCEHFLSEKNTLPLILHPFYLFEHENKILKVPACFQICPCLHTNENILPIIIIIIIIIRMINISIKQIY